MSRTPGPCRMKALMPRWRIRRCSARGAIRSIDVHSRTVEVTAGVGYALRVVALRIPASVSITNRESAQPDVIALAQLKLGDVVRAQFGGTAAPFVVYTIERLGRM